MEEAEDFKCVCSNRNRSALVCELLSNNSLFVGQLYEDKSLALRAGDLIFFTNDRQTVNCYSTIHSYLSIYKKSHYFIDWSKCFYTCTGAFIIVLF